MKVGSIVVVRSLSDRNHLFESYIKWLPVDDEKTPYQIRGILGETVIFEEGIIGHYNGNELGIDINWVREILPPENIEKQIEEIMCILV
jgi:hypothetical protein